ncbi:MAG: D-alanine--D-alanine ligase [Clostridia bacterium]|nr:D-alanine--D-alanine ligase [Clostridia bacterium]
MVSRIRTGVFFGGPSVEHEVSVITAMQAIAALDANRYEIIPVYVTKSGEFYTGEHLKTLDAFRDIPAALAAAKKVVLQKEGKDVQLVLAKQKKLGSSVMAVLDAALLALHGTGGEDGVMQAHFQRLGLPYTGPDVASSAAGMDKWVSKALFRMSGLPCVPALRVSKSAYYADPEAVCASIEGEIGYPAVIKPYNLGSSVGIHKCRDRASLQNALEDAFLYSGGVMAEKAVSNLREINCAVLGDGESARASVCEEPLNATDILTYADKYQSGGTSAKGGAKTPSCGSKGMQSLARQIPAPISEALSEKIRTLAVAAFHAVGAAGCARVDFLMDGATEEIFVNEINTIPGSLAFYLWEASGLSFPALLDEMIALALKRRREEESLRTTFETNLLQTASLGGSKAGKKV